MKKKYKKANKDMNILGQLCLSRGLLTKSSSSAIKYRENFKHGIPALALEIVKTMEKIDLIGIQKLIKEIIEITNVNKKI